MSSLRRNYQHSTQVGTLSLQNPWVVKRRAGCLSMYHRSLADAALQTPREPWRGRAGGVCAPQPHAVADTPGARSDSWYDLEDSFLDDCEGAPFLCCIRKTPFWALCTSLLAPQQQVPRECCHLL